MAPSSLARQCASWPDFWRANAFALACAFTVAVRLHAVRTYGRVVHEFDPYFNLRATEHLAAHGYEAFSQWFDFSSWYPLGRPVGPTVYPALMVTAQLAHALCDWLGWPVSLNDVCVFLPAYGAVLTVAFVALIALEASGSADAAIAAAWVAAFIPAHTMRSVAGAYDNEAVAVPAIACTLWLWVRALRTPRSWPCALAAGLSYGYLAASWGAYPFASNLIALHVMLLVGLGRYSAALHGAYAAFWGVGTLCALQLPVVGRAPLRAAEQLAPLVVMCALCVLAPLELLIRRRALSPPAAACARWLALAAMLLASGCAAVALESAGVVSPLSVRVRSLFVAHSKTGNPLVDSVAEHRTTPHAAYSAYVHAGCVLAPVGAVLSALRWSDASLFALLWLVVSYRLSTRMVRLLVLLAPPVAVASGIAISALGGWALAQIGAAWRAGSLDLGAAARHAHPSERVPLERARPGSARGPRSADWQEGEEEAEGLQPPEAALFSAEWLAEEASSLRHLAICTARALFAGGPQAASSVLAQWRAAQDAYGAAAAAPAPMAANSGDRAASGAPPVFSRSTLAAHLRAGGDLAPLRPIAATAVLVCGGLLCTVFMFHSAHVAKHLSEPVLLSRLRLPNGSAVIADDYREAYWWLREHSHADARVLAWWDYGYHLNAIANRTSLADGNTWNHEHIALVGRCLLLPPADAHSLIRHLADYVLIWTGRHATRRGGDDLAKAAHISRIAASVYPDMDAGSVYMHRASGDPSDGLRRSLLYALHAHGLQADAPAQTDEQLRALGFEEAFTSTHRMARVFRVLRVSEESRAHVAASFARMRACHEAAGELHPRCREGHGYPPALAPTLALARPFG